MDDKKYKNRIVFILTIFLLKSNLLAPYIFTGEKAFKRGVPQAFEDIIKLLNYRDYTM